MTGLFDRDEALGSGPEMPVCRTPRYSPPVHMIKLTKEREIAPYVWVHPDDMSGRPAHSRSVYRERVVGFAR